MFSRIKKFFMKAVPSAKWMSEVHQNAFFTPDISKLELKKKQLLFVYDGWQKDHPRNVELSSNATYRYVAFTQGLFSMFKKDMGEWTYPIALQKNYTCTPLARIKGEIYSVEPNHFLELDKHRLNGVEFTRIRVPLIIPYKEKIWLKDRVKYNEVMGTNLQKGVLVLPEVHQGTVEAWMYVGIQRFWNQRIDAGYVYKPVATYTHKQDFIREFYHFDTDEYNR